MAHSLSPPLRKFSIRSWTLNRSRPSVGRLAERDAVELGQGQIDVPQSVGSYGGRTIRFVLANYPMLSGWPPNTTLKKDQVHMSQSPQIFFKGNLRNSCPM